MPRKTTAIAEPKEPTTPAIVEGRKETVRVCDLMCIPNSFGNEAAYLHAFGACRALALGDRRLIPLLLPWIYGKHLVTGFVPESYQTFERG